MIRRTWNIPVLVPFTQYSCDTLKASQCLFCNEGSNEDTLHEVTLFTVGRGIREAAEASQNREWHVKLQPLNPDGAQSIDNQLMLPSGLNGTYTLKEVKAKMLKNMDWLVNWNLHVPTLIDCKQFACVSQKNTAVCGAAAQADLQQDVLHIMKCATVIGRNVLDSVAKKWSFSGTPDSLITSGVQGAGRISLAASVMSSMSRIRRDKVL